MEKPMSKTLMKVLLEYFHNTYKLRFHIYYRVFSSNFYSDSNIFRTFYFFKTLKTICSCGKEFNRLI